MNIHLSYQKGLFEPNICQIKKTRNHLEIDRIDHIKDPQRGRLVIFLESSLFQSREIYVFLQGNNLIIEAARPVDYDIPVRMHLIEKKTLSDDRGMEIGFSEIQLYPGYRYSIISYRIINPGLLKVILNSKKIRNKINQTIN